MTPPPVAVTVTVEAPAVAVLLAVKVNAELPLPGAAIGLALKLAVTPEGKPETDRETAELNPFETAVEIVLETEPPWATERLVGEAPRLKSGFWPGLKTIERTGCNSIWLGAAPVCPCGKSKKPTPVTCTGTLAEVKLVVAVKWASNVARALVMSARNGLVEPTQVGAGISVIMVFPAASWITIW